MPANPTIDTSAEVGFVSLKELAEMLIRRAGLHEGLYELSVRFNLTVGVFNLPPGHAEPGVINTVAAVGLVKSTVASPLAVDAAVANPPPAALPKPRRKATSG